MYQHDHSILAGSFIIKKRNTSDDDRFDLNDVITHIDKYGSPNYFNDFFEAIKEFVDEHCVYEKTSEVNKIFRCEILADVENYGNGRGMLLRIHSGGYGLVSDIVNTSSGDTEFKRLEHHADVKMFYLYIYVPYLEDMEITKGFIFFENIGIYGVKIITLHHIRKFFSDRKLTFCFMNIAPDAFLEKLFKKGVIQKVSYVKNAISQDKSDNLFLNRGKEMRTIFSPVYKTNMLSLCKEFFKSKDKNLKSKICEIDNVEYDDLKFTFDLNGRERTISLRAIDNLSIVEDLPENLATDSEGRIEMQEFKNYMKKNAEDYIKEMLVS